MSKRMNGTKNIIKPDIPPPTIEDDIRKGFCSSPRQFPPKYLYDEKGSQLFEKICSTPDYYLSREEEGMLQEHADHIISESRPEQIIEFGSGTSRKTQILLDACERQGIQCSYWPMDICGEMLSAASIELKQRYPWLSISSLLGDYHTGLRNTQLPRDKRTLALILGSTIGNMTEMDAITLLKDVRHLLSPSDYFLFGADRVKPQKILEAAYDDSENLTRKFTLNLLDMLNRELDADFDQDQFSYCAAYNHEKERVEMYLISLQAQVISLRKMNKTVQLQAQERILTEVSQKFTSARINTLLESAALNAKQHWIPENGYYSLLLTSPQTS